MNAIAPRPAAKATAWPLMQNNIAREDLDAVIELLQANDPILTQSRNVEAFEREWSAWLGVRHSVFVNSGSSANLITIAALRETRELGEIIVPTLTWSSDIASVIQVGFTPVFVDIDPRTLGMDTAQVLNKLSSRTRAVFLTHVLGYNALDRRLLDGLRAADVPLIEDVCESHGATFEGRKLGTIGLMSNFSFYYAHHMTTVEGGMVCTDDDELYEVTRMMRAHGMVREAKSEEVRKRYISKYPDLNPEFIFAFPGYNVRSTEINAVMGRSQLKRLDDRNALRSRNLRLFLHQLDSRFYRTDFAVEGSCNYAFTLILREPDLALCERVMTALREHGIEYRRGASGGGNQLRQPLVRGRLGDQPLAEFPEVDHVHFFGFYIGNYPELEPDRIGELCALLNSTAAG
ncbi:MAG: DegT/DnrJ/EryC1/StrS family aminotransferase [Gemmatimonadaceae bacterium]|nr:DegT/DnrJ/EryC1/StrS family aminotransferase [Gemmatimonadaceae bacterium]